ncbi:YceK/YidQ family lipoprotein [Ectopseudomonas oleovorans]|nr:YceK/YidQ family lipoprotein [Pseudomonas oleovorans]
MKDMVRQGVLIVLTVLVMGCSTVASRLGPDRPSDLYPATNTALELTGDLWCWYFLACPIVLVSLPVDVALDTLLLPVDTVRLLNRDDSEKKPETSAVSGVTEAS